MKGTMLAAPLALILCLLAAGCTSPTEAEIAPVVTTTPMPLPTVISTAVVTVVATPLAVDTLPPEQYISLKIEKERPDSTIHLVYNGGKGEIFVQNIMMRVTRSDGQVIEKYMNDGQRKPRRGDELVIDGTRGRDEAAVFVTTAGKTYKVIDQPLENPRY